MDYDKNYIEVAYNPEELNEIFIIEFISYRKENILTKDLFEVIAFVNCLTGYASNKFDIDKSYEFESFSCKIVSQNKKINIAIKFFSENQIFFYDKLEATVIAAQINKIISKLEI